MVNSPGLRCSELIETCRGAPGQQTMIRLNNQRALSTGRALTACGALLLVSIAAVVTLQGSERVVRRQGSERVASQLGSERMGGQGRVPVETRSHSPLQATAAFPGTLPFLTSFQATLTSFQATLTRFQATLTRFQEAQFDDQLKPEAMKALLREVEERHKKAHEKLRYYSYILKHTEHQLNEQGVSTKYRVHEYRVFPRGFGLVVTAMLSENGKELTPQKLAKEKANANKEWQKHRKDGQKDRPKDPEKIGLWFEGLDFVALPQERLGDREVIVFSFTPRADYLRPKDSNTLMPDLKGQVRIDLQEKMIVKFQAELMRERRQGGLSGWLSALKPGTAITIENTRIGNGLWVMSRVDVSSIVKGPGFLMLPHTARFRFVDEMSDYREFDPDAADLFQ